MLPPQILRTSSKALTYNCSPKEAMINSDSSNRGNRNFPRNLKTLESTGIPCSQSQEPSPVFLDSKMHHLNLNYVKNQKEQGQSSETSPKRKDDNKQEEHRRSGNPDANSQIQSPMESEDDLQDQNMKSSKRNIMNKYHKDLNIDLSHEKEYVPKPEYYSQTSTPVQNGFQINFNQNNVPHDQQQGLSYKHHLVSSISVPNNLGQTGKVQQTFSVVPSQLIEKVKVE